MWHPDEPDAAPGSNRENSKSNPEVTEPAAEPDGVVALRLAHASRAAGDLIYVARSDTRAARIAAVIQGCAPELVVLHLPPWDSLPYERASPSAAAMGRRMAVLNRLIERRNHPVHDAPPAILLTSPEAASQRLPPAEALAASTFEMRFGDTIDFPALEAYLARAGYVSVDQVASPGEAALRGEVIDLYSPPAEFPSRLSHAEGQIDAIRTYDPVSQRTIADSAEVVLDPASEILLDPAEARTPGMEQRLPRFYSRLDSIFDYLPEAALAADPESDERIESWAEQITDAYQHRLILRRSGGDEAVIPPGELYLGEDEWRQLNAARQRPDLPAAKAETGPNFVDAPDPADMARRYLRSRHSAGDRIVLVARSERQLRRLRRIAPAAATPIKSWDEGQDVAVALLIASLDAGFRYDGATVLAAADLWGPEGGAGPSSRRVLPEAELGIGDIVIHPDHGLGRLEGIETVAAGEFPEDFLRLSYAGPTAVLAPIQEIETIRRYGSGGCRGIARSARWRAVAQTPR